MPAIWDEWFSGNKFCFFDNLPEGKTDNSYSGLMLVNERAGKLVYWIGALVSDDVDAPEEFESCQIPSANAYTFYIKGIDDPALYAMEGECFGRVPPEELFIDADGCVASIERYNCPRFTTPDENGEVILDFCVLVK